MRFSVGSMIAMAMVVVTAGAFIAAWLHDPAQPFLRDATNTPQSNARLNLIFVLLFAAGVSLLGWQLMFGGAILLGPFQSRVLRYGETWHTTVKLSTGLRIYCAVLPEVPRVGTLALELQSHDPLTGTVTAACRKAVTVTRHTSRRGVVMRGLEGSEGQRIAVSHVANGQEGGAIKVIVSRTLAVW